MSAELRLLRPKSTAQGTERARAEPAPVLALPCIMMTAESHELIESIMATMGTQERRDFWRAHVDVLATAWAERGMAAEVIEAVLKDHFEQVRARNRARAKRAKAKDRYAIKFDGPPAVGTVIDLRGRRAVVVAVEAITRKSDGAPSWLITWDVEGRRATSGLRSASVYWTREDGGVP